VFINIFIVGQWGTQKGIEQTTEAGGTIEKICKQELLTTEHSKTMSKSNV